jgi:hypothetical protein
VLFFRFGVQKKTKFSKVGGALRPTRSPVATPLVITPERIKEINRLYEEIDGIFLRVISFL